MGFTDRELFEEFEAGRFPGERFGHEDHVRMAWIYLLRMSLLEALSRFGKALRRFAAAQGAPELYHETVTWAFLILVNERMRTGPEGASWSEFARRNPDLLRWKDGAFFDYYDPEVLGAEEARRFFVLPAREAAAGGEGGR